MLSQKDKAEILELFKKVDVKQMTIDHHDSTIQKWFRFGNFNAMQIASEIIKQLPERKTSGRKSSK